MDRYVCFYSLNLCLSPDLRRTQIRGGLFHTLAIFIYVGYTCASLGFYRNLSDVCGSCALVRGVTAVVRYVGYT